jgi:hypothetical protein
VNTRRIGLNLGGSLLLIAVAAAGQAASNPAAAHADLTAAAVLQEHIREAPVFVMKSAAVAAPALTEEPVPPPAALSPGQLYLVKLAPADEAAARRRVIARVAAEDPDAAASVRVFDGVVRVLSDDGEELDLKPYVRIAKRLRFVPDVQQFLGSLAIGVADLETTRRSATLSAPLFFKVLETGQQVSVDQLSPPYALLDISTGAVARPPTVHVVTNFTAERLATTATFVPTLRVELDHPTLASLGLQTATVTVEAVGGPTVPSGVVSLSAPGAVLDDNRLDFDDHGRASTRLRGALPGRITVAASAEDYDAGAQPLGIVWPWHAIIATLLGSLLGAAIRLSTHVRRGMSAARLAFALAWAALIGEVVFGLYGLVGLLSLLTPLHLDARIADVVAFGAATVAGWISIGVLTPPQELSEGRPPGQTESRHA